MIRLALQSLRFYWRSQLGVLLGVVCASAVLVGALSVGDSVRLSLRDLALQRIGRVDAALVAGDRRFRAVLAERIGADLGAAVAPVLSLPGIARAQEQGTRAGIVDVFGVDDRFFALSPGDPSDPGRPAPADDEAYLSARLAAQLRVGAGDDILVRIEKPSLLPRDMLMATVDDVSFALRLKVAAVVTDQEFGRFGLRASQVPPQNLFVGLRWLQRRLDLGEVANMLLLGGGDRDRPPTDPGRRAGEADAALARHWSLADAQLRTRRLPSGVDELSSDRVFLEPPVAAAVGRIAPRSLGVLTYFVDALRKGDRSTPYSTVAAIGPLTASPPEDPALRATLGLLPEDLAEGEVVLSRWLADDLQADRGDEIAVEYRSMGERLQLEQGRHALRVRSVVPLSGAAADRDLMPEFPGIADSANCRDWEPGIPIDLDRIRKVDEDYWAAHRGTPKAFLRLDAGQALWSNRFGNLTAIRGPEGFAARLAAELPKELEPRALGLFFQDVRTPALRAGTSATDFGGLFLGLSFFLIGSSLLLTSLLFAFAVGQRANEIGTLLAVGLRRAAVRRLFRLQGLLLSITGAALGAALGTGYTRAVLYGLGTLWRDAVGTTTLEFHAPAGTVLLGAAISVVVAQATIALALRRVFDQPAVELLNSKNGIPTAEPPPGGAGGRLSLLLALGCPVAAVALVVLARGLGPQAASGAFFGAGALLLTGGLAACRRVLLRLRAKDTGAAGGELGSRRALAVRNAARRPGRSLATIALLACGTFLVVAVQANRLQPPRDVAERASGTGGFALFGRSTLPVLRDLGTPEGRAAFDLKPEDLQGAAIVPLRVREGDDASCLNLSLAQNPRLVGVQPGELARRGAFVFSGSLPPEDIRPPVNPWQLLDADYGDEVVPAIGDAASITWALHRSLGEDLDYTDEQGRPFRVRLVGAVANSILQGNLLIAERHLRGRFPSATGYRMFLIDAAPDRVAEVESRLSRALEDVGLELTSTATRLREFNAVQNTYLLIFQALGGLGLLLGSIGVGVVVLRNALERRSELALLRAVGYPARAVRELMWNEHGLLLAMGLLTGVVAALLAVLPGTGEASLGPMALLVAAVGLSGALFVWLASAFATRGPLLAALEDE